MSTNEPQPSSDAPSPDSWPQRPAADPQTQQSSSSSVEPSTPSAQSSHTESESSPQSESGPSSQSQQSQPSAQPYTPPQPLPQGVYPGYPPQPQSQPPYPYGQPAQPYQSQPYQYGQPQYGQYGHPEAQYQQAGQYQPQPGQAQPGQATQPTGQYPPSGQYANQYPVQTAPYQQPQSQPYQPNPYPYPPQYPQTAYPYQQYQPYQPYPPYQSYPQYAARPVDPVVARRRALRKAVGRPAGLTLAYQGVFTGASFVCGLVLGLVMGLGRSGAGHASGSTFDQTMQDVAQQTVQWMGVLSLVSVAVGFLFMLLMRHRVILTRAFWLGDPREPHAPMRPAWFAVFVALILGVQGLSILLQLAFSAIGLSLVSPTSESIDESAVTISMWLYIGLFGPIVEEVVFRGVLMKELKPLGKNFAILTSSLMFALFHDDVVQGLFAFGCGLVFAFVAMEYSLIWSIALHIFNNAVLSGVLGEFAAGFGETGNMIYAVCLLVIGIGALIAVLVKYGWGLKQYRLANRSVPGTYWGWTSGLFLTFVILNGGYALLSFVTAMISANG